MCGIIHCKKANTLETAKKLITKRYTKQRARGTEGYGFIELNNGYVTGVIRTQTETEMTKKLDLSTADEIMFHHRTPTSTPNIIESTHPIHVSHKNLKYDYFVIHNGIITNDELLRDEHIKNGYIYTTDLQKKYVTEKSIYAETLWNDSEAVAIDFVEAIEKGKEMQAKGSIAIVALQFDKETGKAISLYFGRNSGNPLCIENTETFFSLSSETGTKLSENILYKYDYDNGNLTTQVLKIGTPYTYTNYDKDDIGYKPISSFGYGYNNYGDDYGDDYDDEFDYDISLIEEREYLKEEITKANQASDYDLAVQLEQDLDMLEMEIDAKRKATKKDF